MNTNVYFCWGRFLWVFSALMLTLVVLASVTSVAWAQEGYDLDWWTADSGGVTGQDGDSGYSLGGTVDQPDVAAWQGAGGYTLSGGFWLTGPAVASYEVFLPVVIRGTGP